MRKLPFLILFILLIGLFPLFAKTKPIVCSEKDAWVNEAWYQKKYKTHYFIGLSSEQQTIEDAIERARYEAFSNVNDFRGVTLSEIFTDYDQQYSGADGQEDESGPQLAMLIVGFKMNMRNYEIVKTCYGGTDKHYNAAVKIAISDEEFQKIRIEGHGKTAWNFKVSQCREEQSEQLEQIFTKLATDLNWNLNNQKQFKKPNFSKNVPETAYFAEVKVNCDGKLEMQIKHHDLIAGTMKTSGGRGNTIEELEADLSKNCKKLELEAKNWRQLWQNIQEIRNEMK